MASTKKNSGRGWRNIKFPDLNSLVGQNLPTRAVDLNLGQAEGAEYVKSPPRRQDKPQTITVSSKFSVAVN